MDATPQDFTPAQPQRGRQGHTLALIAVVVLIAWPIRLFLVTSAAMISRDGAGFIWYAQDLAVDPVAEMRGQAQHPLYPAMILGMHRVFDGVAATMSPAPLHRLLADPVESWQTAAMLVTLLGGLAVVVAVYALARVLFGPRIGLIAAVLAAGAAEFCQLSADALSDMPHLAVYLFGLAAGTHGVKRRCHGWLALAGGLSGMAHLIRPEGAEVAVALCAAVVWQARSWGYRRVIAGLLSVGLPALAVAAPYMVVTGKLVRKKPLEQFLPWSTPGEAELSQPPSVTSYAAGEVSTVHTAVMVSTPHSTTHHSSLITHHSSLITLPPFGQAIARIAEDYIRALRVTLLLPAIAWPFLRRRRKSTTEPFPGTDTCDGTRVAMHPVAFAAMLHLLILFALILGFDYLELFSMRHVLVLAALTLPYSAAGVAALVDLAPPAHRRLASITLPVVLIAATAPWMLQTRNADTRYLRMAGEWLRAQDTTGPRVLTTRMRVAFYAAGRQVWSPADDDMEENLAIARAEQPDYLVFDLRRIPDLSDLAPDDRPEGLAERLRSLVRPGEILELLPPVFIGGKGGRDQAVIFRYHPPPG